MTDRTRAGTNSCRRRDDGAAAVEFALVAPVLLIVVFGIISFGIVFAQQLALGNAARQVSRFGVVAGQTCGALKSEMKDTASTIAMPSSKVTPTVSQVKADGTVTKTVCQGVAQDGDVPCAGSSPGDSLQVTLAYKSKLIIPLVVAKDTFNLQGTGIFRCETS